ncbi:hypothetical protein F5B22DRAFT_644891 [Xylaria bambusicola]|uniref:uncharacterized protein n=1 Tax=Xylaria bambusicola TaxID=326684 RepID=UPI002007647F|nr:uncharacterized protein F5B22DRAFT_644891 [Xylaria bambusicola]KAI0518584.1 hypothetical protein F5B22DRAFT_644891 [Xylaria bambusicola]
MRLAFRTAANNKHELLVPGALGCGGCQNPPHLIVRYWISVLDEPEFQGWWREIWFAIIDQGSENNFNIFYDYLDEYYIGAHD